MHEALLTLYGVVQVLFLFSLLVTVWFLVQKVDLVQKADSAEEESAGLDDGSKPPIVMFYPVLKELESTMRTTFTEMAKASYPQHLLRVIAIPNDDDVQTIASLRRLQTEFTFLELMPVPPTDDPSWNVVFSSWDNNPKAYWWHAGKRAGDTALPPKKTRQLVWAAYQVFDNNPATLMSYIDADSVVPKDYFEIAAVGSKQYDVIQLTNITGNLMKSWPSSFFAMDHISWDSTLYKHMTAGGKHPYYVLGKGLFFRFSDLLDAGGLHPWLTIEDPEIGMRMWTNGYRLGVAETPLVEEVPATFMQGITQRKRWMAGFFQSLGGPLTSMGMPLRKRIRARMNFVPCLSLLVTPLGLGVGIWAIAGALTSAAPFISGPLQVLSVINVTLAIAVIGYGQFRAWKMSRPVLPARRDRARFLLRVNPVFLMMYWTWWAIPLAIGFWMFVRDTGQVWQRTEKIDANRELFHSQGGGEHQKSRALNTPGSAPSTSDTAFTGPAK